MALPILFVAVIVGVSLLHGRATPHAIGTVPRIVSFTANPPVAHAGEPVTLAWNARGADSLTLSRSTSEKDQADEPAQTRLPDTGKVVVHPKRDTVYTLTCVTADGPMCTTQLTVRAE